MGDRQVAPPTIEGVLLRLGQHRYIISQGPVLGDWLENRLRDMPIGAYVRFTAEVLDPHPEENNGHRNRERNDHDRTSHRTSPQP